MYVQLPKLRQALHPRAVRAANTSVAAIDLGANRFSTLLFTLNVFSAERDSANETYDIYVTTGTADGQWDIVHFPQVLTTGAKIYVARIAPLIQPGSITTAAPGVAAIESGTLRIDTPGSNNGVKTLAAGLVRHGPVGPYLGVELVVAGTIATGIDFEVVVEAA